jgi:hypothetical protein
MTTTISGLALAASLVMTPARIAAVADADAGARDAVVERIDDALQRWQASCPKAGTYGLCVKFSAPAASAKARQCHAPRLGQVKVIARRKSAAKAQADLAAALADGRKLTAPRGPAAAADFQAALGRAHLAITDADLEAYLKVTMPDDLDFFVEEWKKDSGNPKYQAQYEAQVRKRDASVKKFKAFFDTASEGGNELRKAHVEIKSFADAQLVLDASLRTALAAQHFADQLRTAPLPKSMSTDEMKDAYCGALEDQTEPVEQMAQMAALYCLERAKTTGLTGDTVTACQELYDRYPAPATEPTK